MIEYGIMEQASGRVHQTLVMDSTNLSRNKLNGLRHSVKKLNESLAEKGKMADRVRGALQIAVDPAAMLSKLPMDEITALREWEQGSWSDDPPSKDKHFVLVKRNITRWEEEA